MPLTAAEVKQILGLQPHPREGGWYVRTYESAEYLGPKHFSESRYTSPRRVSTAIYYLLEPDTFSEMHCLQSDEVFHHYMGGPVKMLQLHPDGQSEQVTIGSDLLSGERPQVVVPRGTWQGARLLGEEGFALLGCTVSPGFEFEDYRSATREDMITRWPEEAALITALTRY